MSSEIITKTTEIAEKTFSINHSVVNGQSILIGVKDEQGQTRILLEIKAGADYIVNLKGTITDTKIRG